MPSLPPSEAVSSPVSTPQHKDTGSEISFKCLYYLISTLNLLFSDYDFSDIDPTIFVRQPESAAVISNVNTTLFAVGVNKNFTAWSIFSRSMWDVIDAAIGLNDSEIYTFQLGERHGDIDDPFWERGCM